MRQLVQILATDSRKAHAIPQELVGSDGRQGQRMGSKQEGGEAVKLDFYEADVLGVFLQQHRKEFVRCAQDFDDYTDTEAGKMLDKISAKVTREMFADV